MDSPLPVEFRPARPDDIAAIGALVRRAEAFDGVPRVLADEELEQELSASHIDLEVDTRVAVLADEIVAWSSIWNPLVDEGLDRAELQGEVAPEHRGQGVGRAILRWGIERATARLDAHVSAADGPRPRAIRLHAYDWQEDRHRLYRRLGFEPVRWHDELIRPLDADGLPDVPPPSGIALRAWPDANDPNDPVTDEAVRHVRNAAFADHWGSTIVDPDLWHDFVRGHGARPDLSLVALDEATGEIVGACVNQAYPEDEEATGRRDAWIANICTLRPARGRGIASAMIAWSLRAFTEAGFDHAVLEVDTDNPTGAARLYRNLGFEPLHRSITFELRSPGDDDADGAPS